MSSLCDQGAQPLAQSCVERQRVTIAPRGGESVLSQDKGGSKRNSFLILVTENAHLKVIVGSVCVQQNFSCPCYLGWAILCSFCWIDLDFFFFWSLLFGASVYQ